MKIRIAVGVTREWEEEALPLLLHAGLRVVAMSRPPEADGELVECDLECSAPIASDALFSLLDRVRAIVAESMVAHVSMTFVSS